MGIGLGLGSCGRVHFDPVDANLGCPMGEAKTIVVRDGLGGYAGTVDTVINRADPGVDSHSLDRFLWHDDSPMISLQCGLLRFDNLFSPTAVPAHARITSATLTLTIIDACGGVPGDVSEVAIDWGSTVAWDTFGDTAGVQPEDVRTRVADAPQALGVNLVDVTTSLQSWALDPTLNNGWIFSPAPNNGDACAVASTDSGDPTQFPQLTVELVCP